MQPVRMKAEVPTDLEGIRQALLGLSPQLEPRQPGITEQIRHANLQQPLMMTSPSGESVTVIFEPQSERSTAIKVEVRPPAKPLGKLRERFWRWRTRLMLKFTLKRAKNSLEKQAAAGPRVEVLPPEK